MPGVTGLDSTGLGEENESQMALGGVLTMFLIYSDLLLCVCLTVVYWLKLSYTLIPGLIYNLYFSA